MDKVFAVIFCFGSYDSYTETNVVIISDKQYNYLKDTINSIKNIFNYKAPSQKDFESILAYPKLKQGIKTKNDYKDFEISTQKWEEEFAIYCKSKYDEYISSINQIEFDSILKKLKNQHKTEADIRVEELEVTFKITDDDCNDTLKNKVIDMICEHINS